MSHMTVTENLHRVPVPVTPDVGLVLGWLGMHGKGDNIVIMMLDGRSRTCRRKLESFVEDHFVTARDMRKFGSPTQGRRKRRIFVKPSARLPSATPNKRSSLQASLFLKPN